MYLNHQIRKTYSNIQTKNLPNQVMINPKMIVDKQIVDHKTKRNGETEPVYEMKLNIDFWKNIKEPINVVLDEAHSIINARRSMSKVNIIMNDWLSLIRRVLGQSESGYGELVYITQLPNRIDTIARDMAHQVRYHVCHYHVSCNKCGTTLSENSEIPEPTTYCPSCGSFKLKKFNHKIEIWHFNNMRSYEGWREFGMNNFYKHYIVTDIEKYFPMYNTLQWDNMFSELY